MFKCGYLSGSLWVGNSSETVYPCCYTNNKEITTKGEGDFLNNSTVLKMRREALQDKTPLLCELCEQKGKEREYSLTLFNNKGFVKEYINFEDVERLYISLGNVCNLKCTICSGSQSHLIKKETNPDKNPYEVNTPYLEWIKENASKFVNLNTVQFTGGEPFYNRKNLLDILKVLPSNISIFPIRTNGTIYDEEILKEFIRFNKVAIATSIDGMEGSFEYQRVGSDWEETKQVLYKIKNFTDEHKNVYVQNDFTVTWANVDRISDFDLFAKNIYVNSKYHDINYPYYWQLKYLNHSYLKEVKSKILKIKNAQFTVRKIDKILEDNIVPTKEEIKKMWSIVEYMKEKRGVSLEEKIPHLLDNLVQ